MPVSKKLLILNVRLSLLSCFTLKLGGFSQKTIAFQDGKPSRRPLRWKRWGQCFVSTAGPTRADLVRRNPICLFTLPFQKPWMKIPVVRQISDQWKKEEAVWVSGQGDSLQRILYIQGTEKWSDVATQSPTAAWWRLFFQLVQESKDRGSNRRSEKGSAEEGIYHNGKLSQVKLAEFSL